jgi:hypothetical protein
MARRLDDLGVVRACLDRTTTSLLDLGLLDIGGEVAGALALVEEEIRRVEAELRESLLAEHSSRPTWE